MRQSGRVIALSLPSSFNSKSSCVGSSPICKCDHRRNKETSSAHPFSKEELGILGRESATLVMRNQSQTDFVSRICSSHPAQGKWRAHILCTMRSGPARFGHRVRFTTAPALVSGRSRNLSRFAIPSGSGCLSNRMDDLTSHSEVVHCALCRHWNGAAVKISTDTIVALILRVREGLNHG